MVALDERGLGPAPASGPGPGPGSGREPTPAHAAGPRDADGPAGAVPRAARLSVIIPAWNEAEGIAAICRRVLATEAELAAAGIPDLELIVVDDGSSDGTAEIARAVDGVAVIEHPSNRGYGAAIKTGFRAATGDLLAFLDADGTYPPESYPAMARRLLEERADIVVGVRMSDPASGMPLVRRIGNRAFVGLVNLIGVAEITDSASGQRILRRDALERLYPLPDGLNFTPVMTTRAIHEDLRMIEVPIRYEERVGRSKLSVIHDGRRFLTTIVWTALGYNPARVLGFFGLGALALAGALGAMLVAMRLAGVSELGPWGVAAAFATMVCGVVGVSILNLGITFNSLVSLFHAEPVRQGVFARRAFAGGLDRRFGWLGLTGLLLGLALGATGIGLGVRGWEITRVWLWLLGGALGTLVGTQLIISWVLVRVLQELSERATMVRAEIDGPAVGERSPGGIERAPAGRPGARARA